MSLKIDNKWLWDFWFAVDGDDYHIFYLQADRTLTDAQLRHWNVSVGHAVSKDLINWTPLVDAIWPSQMPQGNKPEPADSYTTWTGSIIKEGNTWFMFYTGTKKSEEGLIQRICLATSNDLLYWEKQEKNPLVELDPRWYDGLNTNLWHDASWRDPWVVKDPDDGLFHMYITCRTNTGEADGRGAIGHAYSENLIDWIVSKPIVAPGLFGEMEVSQIEKINDTFYLFYSVSAKYHSVYQRNHMTGPPLTGVQYLVSDNLNGPYVRLGDGFIVADEIGSFYSGRVIKSADNSWYLLGFLCNNQQGGFVGEISDPLRIEVHSNGQLLLESAEEAFFKR